jgi:hypothetical protein
MDVRLQLKEAVDEEKELATRLTKQVPCALLRLPASPRVRCGV